MLRTLDPHTSFLNAESYASMRDRQQSSFSGLGILVGMRNGRLTVITPIEGTPASRLGLRAGDVIHDIEGEPTEGLGLDEAVRKLKGPKGSQVTISIVRRGLGEPLELTITRDEIPQNSVRYAYMIGTDTGYIAISDFNRGTGREVAAALDTLKKQGMEKLLLDLRGNGGGLLDQAIEVADQFLPPGAKIVETRGRTRDSFQEFFGTDDYPELEIPVVVLVSGGTASAAEILAGALQDHDFGLIAGNPTWGKGLVQTVYSLSYDAGLALTTAKYYTPSGRLIQRDYSSWFDYATHSNGHQVEGDQVITPEGEEVEVFLTDLGRRVYGGGGITPDVVLEERDLPALVQFLLSRGAFFDFALDFLQEHKVHGRDWRPPPDILSQFSDWLLSKELFPSREDLDKQLADDEARAVCEHYIHAEIFNSALGLEARHQVISRNDPQIQQALDLFPEATRLLARRMQSDRSEGRTAKVDPADAALQLPLALGSGDGR
jgi:carboxyl-terminal processing protease